MNASPLVMLTIGFAAGFLARSFLWLAIAMVIVAIVAWLYLGSGSSGSNVLQGIRRLLRK